MLSSKSYYRIYSALLTGGDLKISYKVPEKVQKFLFKSLGLVCRPFKLHNSTRSEIFCSTHCPTKSGPRVRSRFRAKHRLLDLPAVLIQQDGVGPHAKTGSAIAPCSPGKNWRCAAGDFVVKYVSANNAIGSGSPPGGAERGMDIERFQAGTL